MRHYRIGHGFDVHQLKSGRKLILGGVHIPFEKGAVGHSDADVLSHAICDALLGAAGLGDIGQQFPDTDPQYKNISSLILLKQVLKLLRQNGYFVGNIDSTVVLQEPTIKDFIPEIRNVLSEIIGLDHTKLSVKAKTSENLGFIGRGEGIAAEAVVLLYYSDSK